MKTSIFFLVLFTCEVLFGGITVHWHSWLWGLATGVSVFQIALPLVKRWLRE